MHEDGACRALWNQFQSDATGGTPAHALLGRIAGCQYVTTKLPCQLVKSWMDVRPAASPASYWAKKDRNSRLSDSSVAQRKSSAITEECVINAPTWDGQRRRLEQRRTHADRRLLVHVNIKGGEKRAHGGGENMYLTRLFKYFIAFAHTDTKNENKTKKAGHEKRWETSSNIWIT